MFSDKVLETSSHYAALVQHDLERAQPNDK